MIYDVTVVYTPYATAAESRHTEARPDKIAFSMLARAETVVRRLCADMALAPAALRAHPSGDPGWCAVVMRDGTQKTPTPIMLAQVAGDIPSAALNEALALIAKEPR